MLFSMAHWALKGSGIVPKCVRERGAGLRERTWSLPPVRNPCFSRDALQGRGGASDFAAILLMGTNAADPAGCPAPSSVNLLSVCG